MKIGECHEERPLAYGWCCGRIFNKVEIIPCFLYNEFKKICVTGDYTHEENTCSCGYAKRFYHR